MSMMNEIYHQSFLNKLSNKLKLFKMLNDWEGRAKNISEWRWSLELASQTDSFPQKKDEFMNFTIFVVVTQQYHAKQNDGSSFYEWNI